MDRIQIPEVKNHVFIHVKIKQILIQIYDPLIYDPQKTYEGVAKIIS